MVKVNTHIFSLYYCLDHLEHDQWLLQPSLLHAPHMLYAAIGGLKIDLFEVPS